MSLQKHQNWRSWLKQSQLLKTADQNWWSWSKQSQLWKPLLLLVVVGLFLILFKAEILFESERQGYYWKVDARNWTGLGQSYDNDVSEVTEKGTEATGTITKRIDKTTTTAKRLQPAKTLWDWMTLLLAPATLAGLGFLFQSSQEKAKRDKEEADKARDADQQREHALQTYFDQLSALLVDKQLKKLLMAHQATVSTKAQTEEGADSSVATEAVMAKPELSIDTEAALNVVKARTLSLLRMFDDDIPRKASVLSFLADANLLNQLDLDLIFIRLNGANLKKVNFSACKLRGANLQNTILISADLSGGDLSGANLSKANLSDANLISADLRDANLYGINLSGANVSDADCYGANLVSSNLGGADFHNTDLRDAKLRGVTLRGTLFINADLRYADLSDADLRGAFFDRAKLSNADFRGAFFRETDLNGADLSFAKFWDSELVGADLDRAKKDAIAHIQSAKNWQKAYYDPEMLELLGLSPEASKAKAND